MAQSLYLREQAERCRRLARDSTDPALRDSLLLLAEEYAARADAEENVGAVVWRAGPHDRGTD
jgi:hypothetical protein